MPASYNGWLASRSYSAIGVDPNFTAAGRKFPGGVKSGDVATVFRYFVEQFDRRVEEVDLYSPGDEWGWYYKSSANASYLLSCHSSGTALDLNATRHPNGRRGTFSSAQVSAIRQILAECSHVIRWGGDFAGTKDEMHFEINGSVANVRRAAERIRQGQPAPAPIPPPTTEPQEDIVDLEGLAWMLMRSFLGRDPNNQIDLDVHHWRLAELKAADPQHYIKLRCGELASSSESSNFDAWLANELKARDQ